MKYRVRHTQWAAFGAILFCLMAFQPNEATVHWLTFEEAVEKSKTEPRMIFVDVYTDWCGYCKKMDRETFDQANVATLLNEKFYPVKLNAEQRADIEFDGHTFKYVEKGSRGYHELAASLLSKRMSYPTVVFLTEDFEILQAIPGYRKADEFYMMASFIGEGHFRDTSWEAYVKSFQANN